VLCAGALLASERLVQAQQLIVPAKGAYFRGKLVRFTPAAAKRGRALVVGNALLGPIQADHRQNDHRPNVYIVCPGTQFRSGSGDAVAFNLVLNTLPLKEDAVQWDVYWAITLDPALRTNFINERDLLLATQNTFVPGELFDFDEVPGRAVLREYLHVVSLAGLGRFRRRGGTLPQVLILPSHFVIRASAGDSDSPAPSKISSALSRLSPPSKPAPAANVTK
jgi:hypothetical protein